MSVPSPTRVLVAAAAMLLCASTAADAQINRLKKAAQEAAERETANQVDRLVTQAVQCAFDDPRCIEEAEESGQPVVLIDSEGRVITDEEGRPITDPDAAAAQAGGGAAAAADGAGAPQKPGEGVWTNYDFVRGERILFAEDFSGDRVGDFPRSLEFVNGNMEVVEWEGGRALRSSGDSRFNIQLPETLPERFTIEFDYYQSAGHYMSSVATAASQDENTNSYVMTRYPGSYFRLGNETGVEGEGPESTTQTYRTREGMTAIRIHVDGSYVKMYTDEERVANIPNAVILREDKMSVHLHGRQQDPAYMANIVVAAGGRELYDVLQTDGRVATQGILFDTNSDVIRPESTPTLREIGEMLQAHGDMSLAIEGHTDSEGDSDYNLELSQRRAAAVVRYLVDAYGIEAGRLSAEGLGESVPVGDNSTPEGRQQNRRVELVVR